MKIVLERPEVFVSVRPVGSFGYDALSGEEPLL